MTVKTVKDFRKSLYLWFEENKRNLPWRHTEDPYHIWVSEIILQQTTVAQGLDYYLRFIDTFPTVNDLANSTEQKVLKLWEGLGYYSRARHMHHTANAIVEKSSGYFPATHKELLALKGIGPYTAAALMSFAFNKPYPVIDGNVMRVVSRLFDIAEPINSTKGIKKIEEKVNLLFDKKKPANYNQALMEFGAIHCKVSNPQCEACFAANYCLANINNTQNLLPVKEKKVKLKTRCFYYFMPLIDKKGVIYTYLKKREDKDIWQNLYDFILFETSPKSNPREFINTTVFRNFLKQHDLLKPANGFHFSNAIVHKLTHQTIVTYFVSACVNNFKLESPYIMVEFSKINNYPLPKLLLKYLNGLSV